MNFIPKDRLRGVVWGFCLVFGLSLIWKFGTWQGYTLVGIAAGMSMRELKGN